MSVPYTHFLRFLEKAFLVCVACLMHAIKVFCLVCPRILTSYALIEYVQLRSN